MDYDQVLRCQRKLIYDTRNQLLEGGGMDRIKLRQIAEKNVRHSIASGEIRDIQSMRRYILDNVSYHLDDGLADLVYDDLESVTAYLLQRIEQGIEEQQRRLGSRKRLYDFMRVAALNAIDDGWVEQVDYLQQIQAAVSGRSSAQRNPIYEFQKDALESFRKMEVTVLRNIMRNILLSNTYVDAKNTLHIILP